MSATSKPKQIDALMEKASQALARTEYFEAERQAEKALGLARQANDFGRMARILMPLQEARRQRLQVALEIGHVTILDRPVVEHMEIDPGCYLVRPPQVGADARRLRLAALHHEVPVAIVCREPLTQMKLCPIVAIGPGVTVREKTRPPRDPDAPDFAWFVDAMEALGDAAIDFLDPALTTLKRLDALMGRLEAIPDHEGLHLALEETCRAAEREAAEEAAAPKRATSRAGAKRA